MNTTTRSDARRAYLTKAAQMLPSNPAQGLGFPDMFGGGSTAGDASIAALGLTLGAPAEQLANPGGVITGKAAKARAEKRALDNVTSEVGGTIAAPLIGATGGTAVGAIIGAALAAARGKRISRGAGAGAALGLTLGVPAAQLANLGGVLTGVIRKRRTKKEQQEHDSKSHWSNLIPGVGSYNYTKRMGRVLAGVGEPDEQKKAAEALPFNPAQALGYAGMLGGGALASDAAMNGEQSTIERIGKGALSAGLAYAGHKALTDKKWQDAIGSGTQRAMGYIRKFLNKAAEAPDAAYIEGFCKAAEAVGVDPVALYKQAAPWAAIGKMVGKGMDMTRRAVQPKANALVNMVRANGVRGTLREGALRARSGIRNYYDLLRGANVDKYKHMEESMANLTRRAAGGAPTSANMQLYARGNRAWSNATAAREAAEQATHNARRNLGVAAGVLGGGVTLGHWGSRLASGGGDQPQGQIGTAPTSGAGMA